MTEPIEKNKGWDIDTTPPEFSKAERNDLSIFVAFALENSPLEHVESAYSFFANSTRPEYKDDHVPQDITAEHAAKNLTQHMVITIPPRPKIQLKECRGASIQKLFTQIAKCFPFIAKYRPYESGRKQGEEKQEEAEKSKIIQSEKETLECIANAGAHLRYACRKGHRKYCEDQLIYLEKNEFESEITSAMERSLDMIRSKHWRPIKDVPTPQIVNPDFKEKATRWLCDQVYARAAHNLEFAFLESVAIKRYRELIRLRELRYDDKGNLLSSPIYRPLNCKKDVSS